MNRSTLAALLCLAVGGVCTDAGAQAIRLQRTGEAAVAVQPGEVFTMPFRLTNPGGARAEVSLHAAAPAGLRTVLHGPDRSLPGGAVELVLVGIRVAESAPAGRHSVLVVAASAAGNAEDSVWIDVGARRGVEAVLDRAPAVVLAGDAYALRFRVRNAGNAPERIVVLASGDRGVAPVPELRTVELAPGGSAVLEYSVDTRPLGHRNLRHQIVLRISAADGDSSVTAVARSLVEVVPRGPARGRSADAAGHFPVEMRLRASEGMSVVGLEARGGTMKGGKGIEFLARNADPRGVPFAREDEYYLRLASRTVELRLGDGPFGLTAIGGPARYAAGGSAALRRGPFQAGGFVAGDRRTTWAAEDFGGFVRAGGERAGVGIIGEGGFGPTRTGGYAAQAWFQPGRLLRAAGEVGVGGVRADASPPRRVTLHGSTPHVWYDMVHSRPRDGAATGSDVDAAAVSFRPLPELSLLASYRRGMEPDSGAAPGGRTVFREQVRARIDVARHLNGEVRSERWLDVSGYSMSQTVRVGLVVPLGPLRLAPAAEWETRGTGETEGAPPYRMRELRTDARARGIGVSARVRREEGRRPGALNGSGRWTLGADGWTQPGSGPRLRMSAGAVRTDSAKAFAGFYDLSVEQRLLRGQEIALRVLTHLGSTDRPATLVQLEYRVPLSVPVPGRRAEGLTVTVVDVVTGRGADGAIVRVAGRTAVTGRGGVAVIENVPAGRHPIRVERASLGPRWVTRSGESAAVNVAADGRGQIRVEVAGGGTLSGRVLRVPVQDGAAREPLGGIEIILEGNGPERRTTTSADGSYRFEGLWPGWWRLSFVESSLPRHHEPKEPSAHFQVTPYSDEIATFLVLERARAVRLIDGGELTPQP